jgi:translocation and assembly module TamB
MTQPPATPPNPLPPHRRSIWPTVAKVGAAVGGVVVAIGGAAVLWGGDAINDRLMPMVEDTLETTLDRPVELGDVESLSFNGVRVGPSALPPTDEVDTEATVEAIDISISWPDLLFNLTAKTSITLIEPNISIVQAADGRWVDLTLPEPDPDAKEFPIQFELDRVRVENATISVDRAVARPAALVEAEPIVIENLNADAQFLNTENQIPQEVAFEVEGRLGEGKFQAQGNGRLPEQAVNVSLQTTDLPTTGVNLFLPPELGLAAGTLNSNLTLDVRLQDPDQLATAQGTARFRDGEVRVGQISEPITNINSSLRFQGDQVTLEDTGLQVGDIPLEAAGTVDLKDGYDLTATIPAVSIATVTDLLALELPVEAAGEFRLETAVTGALTEPRLVGNLENLGLVQVDKLTVDGLTANFAATSEQVDLRSLRITPSDGGFITAAGQVDLANLEDPALDFTLQADLPGDALAATYGASLPNGAVIGAVQAEADLQGTVTDPLVQARFRLPESTYPGRGELTFRDNTLVVDNTQFQVEEGIVEADATVRLDQGTWAANVATANVPVNRFTDQVQGLLSAELTAAGTLDNLSLQGIQASGSAQIADAVVALAPGQAPLLEPGDWNTTFRWRGDGIQVGNFTAPGVDAAGFVAVDPAAAMPLGPVDLDVALRNYDLGRLAQFAPPQVQEQLALRGTVGFSGQLRGALDALQLAGTANLDQLALNTFAFAPRLSGPVDFALQQGGSVDLQGGGDRIAATLGPDYLPETFDIRQGKFVATGQMVDWQLTARVENFPIGSLNFNPVPASGLGTVTGIFGADLVADLRDLQNPSVTGTATVADPALGTIVANSLDAEFRYGDGRAELTDGNLLFKDSHYRLAGWADLQQSSPQFYAQADILSGNFQDILSTLNWATFEDIGFRIVKTDPAGAAALGVKPDSLPQTTFLGQLQAFAQFMLAYEQQLANTDYALPPLDQLEGDFSGSIVVQGESLDPQDIRASADLQGQNWAWGGLLTCPAAAAATPCNRFVLDGTYDRGMVAITPILFEADEARISLQGQGTPSHLDGQFQVSGIPVALADAFVDIPVELGGQLELIALLGGSLENPSAQGNLAVVGPTINEDPLESVGVDFTYDLAHLRFDGSVVLQEPARIDLQGDIPYALPFMAVQPDNDLIAVEAVLQNEGMEILNLITDNQVRWESGQGKIEVQVGGTLMAPAIVGSARFADGVIAISALSQPIEDLTGEVAFNLDRVRVEQLQANYGEGNMTVVGQIPLHPPEAAMVKASDAPSTGGITIALNQLPADYAGFVKAQIDGQVLISDAVLTPVMTGNIQISKGQVRPNDLLGKAGALPVPTQPEEEAPKPLPPYIRDYKAEYLPPLFPTDSAEGTTELPLERFRFNDLTITLADELFILGQPLYSLAASGDLTINGTLANLQPSGVITLESGWLNLFSTQFRLEREVQNTATFFPETGLDPFLDVTMLARVQDADVTQTANVNPFISSEVNDVSGITTFGEVEFVTIYAQAYGYASELEDRPTNSQIGELVTLTSRPSRSQNELLALLGSSVINNIYGATFNQLAGFLGAGSVASFGERFTNAVGLRSFSIFPTTDTATESTAGIGIGVEAAFDIGNSFSVDILEILNSGNPPQLGASYRINDQLRLRGTSNLSGGDETITIEYETRF